MKIFLFLFLWIFTSKVIHGHPYDHFGFQVASATDKSSWSREATELMDDYYKWLKQDNPEEAFALGVDNSTQATDVSIEAFERRHKQLKIFNKRAKKLLKVQVIFITMSITDELHHNIFLWIMLGFPGQLLSYSKVL